MAGDDAVRNEIDSRARRGRLGSRPWARRVCSVYRLVDGRRWWGDTSTASDGAGLRCMRIPLGAAQNPNLKSCGSTEPRAWSPRTRLAGEHAVEHPSRPVSEARLRTRKVMIGRSGFSDCNRPSCVPAVSSSVAEPALDQRLTHGPVRSGSSRRIAGSRGRARRCTRMVDVASTSWSSVCRSGDRSRIFTSDDFRPVVET